MNSKQLQRAVPKLRFVGFEGEWERNGLNELANLKNGYAFKSSTYSEFGEYCVVTIANVQSGKLNLESIKRISNVPSDIQPHQRLGIGDILISMTGNVGRVCKVDVGNLVLNQRVGKLVPSKIDPDFFYHILQAENFRSAMQTKAVGGAQGNLSSGDIAGYMLCHPSLISEQQKIADCLSSLDVCIGAETRKLDVLKAHKQGLMRQLFPAEGDKAPRLRFPAFETVWLVKPLSELAANLDNRRVPVTESNRDKGDIPYYGASGVVDYINDFIFDEDLLCVSEDGANLVARTTPIAFSISGKAWVNNHAHVLRFESWHAQKLVEDYLNFRSLEDFLTGMAQPKLNRAMLDVIPVPIPQSEDERKKIAGCLASLDSLITLHSRKIAAHHQQKKGLMQGLFPVLAA